MNYGVDFPIQSTEWNYPFMCYPMEMIFYLMEMKNNVEEHMNQFSIFTNNADNLIYQDTI